MIGLLTAIAATAAVPAQVPSAAQVVPVPSASVAPKPEKTAEAPRAVPGKPAAAQEGALPAKVKAKLLWNDKAIVET